MARILVLDDDEANAEAVKTILESRDHEAVIVSHPRQALAMLRTGEDFDLIISDFHMPDMNGVQFSREVSRLEKPIPVIIRSSQSEEEIKASPEYSGVSAGVIADYVNKTDRFSMLLYKIGNILQNPKTQISRANVQSPPEPDSPSQSTIS